MQEEGLQKTAHDKIFIGELSDLTFEELEQKLDKLRHIIKNENTPLQEMDETMREVVPTYHHPEEMNKEVKNARKEIEKSIKNIFKGKENKIKET